MTATVQHTKTVMHDITNLLKHLSSVHRILQKNTNTTFTILRKTKRISDIEQSYPSAWATWHVREH